MDLKALIPKICNTLEKCGFDVWEERNTRIISFDIVARKDALLLVMKVLGNIDSLTKDQANDLMVLAKLLKASPVVIGLKSTLQTLEDGIIYLRYGVPIITPNTLDDFFLEGIPPLIYAAPGGFYVNIDGRSLKSMREKEQIGLGTLANVAGVSRKAIQMYEDGMSATVDVTIKLEEFLGRPLSEPLDPFKYCKELEEILTKSKGFKDGTNDVFMKLDSMGYEVIQTHRCPFDALSKDAQNLILTGVEKAKPGLEIRARMTSEISRIADRYSVFIMDAKVTKKNIAGTPVITKKELKKMSDSEEVIELIVERK